MRYLQCFRLHISPCKISSNRLDTIDYKAVKGFILELKSRYCLSKPKPLSKNSIRNILAALRLILAEAEADGHIKGNPAANKKLSQFYRTAGRKEEINPFTISEVHQLEAIFRDKYPWYYALVVCLFRTRDPGRGGQGPQVGGYKLQSQKDHYQKKLVLRSGGNPSKDSIQPPDD